MKWFIALSGMLLSVLSLQVQGATPADWNTLATCLPTQVTLDGFRQDVVEGENDELPYAVVMFVREGRGDVGEEEFDEGITLSVTITDCIGDPKYLESMMEIDPEIDEAYTYKGSYSGKKSMEEDEEGIHSCSYTLVVNNRFLVEVGSFGMGDFFAELNQLLAGINWDELKAIP